ncbi:MAG: Unknown protein [uncultured Sulfurovum sp.]|uniref:Uncharacterized protein n=1 Tax=uncultured Sulfurovum sp. TaxID=269237 RepID=A0A6S6U4H3_9BACT|nr:MAG: Unknown protein [uncultured Sulfurovum sp.]
MLRYLLAILTFSFFSFGTVSSALTAEGDIRS